MSARFNDVLVVIGGQSQAIMAITGGGETVDAPLAGQPTAAGRLSALLGGMMQGVGVAVQGSTGETAVASTALLKSYQGNGLAFWDDATASFDIYGTAQRNYIQARANPARLCVFLHWIHSQDASSSAWSDSHYATQLGAYYDALNAACAPLFGEFRILAVPVASRMLGDEGRVSAMRRINESLGGGLPFAGAARRSFVLRPVHPGAYIPVGSYTGGGDYVHIIRSTAWRIAAQSAVRIAGQNGFVPAPIDQPQLARAVRTAPVTIRAYITSPQRVPIKMQGNPDFRLTVGSVTATGPIDNGAVSATGYATCDLTVSGVTAASRLRIAPEFGQFTGFVNGSATPRGLVVRAAFADPTPGAGLSVSDGAEDVLSLMPIMHVAPNDAGVPVEQ